MKGDIMRVLAFACTCAVVALIAGPAFADIKSFNTAVNAGEFKKAAAEAASTWPTLDKSRADIGLIAREFGFVSYVAKDYAAAKTYAEFAAAHKAEEPEAAETQTLANILLRAAEYRLKPSEATRDALFGALEMRAALPSFDNISFAATEAVVGHDLEKGRWRDAMSSTELGTKLATAGGAYYAYERRKYELYRNVADYRVREKAETYDRLTELIEAICVEAAAIPSDRPAQRFVELFWEAWAWRATLSAHLTSRRVSEHLRASEQRKADEKARWERFTASEQLRRRLGQPPTEPDAAACEKTFDARRKPEFPSSALHRGFVGSVVLRANIDDSGKLQNPEILAAVPEKYFGGAVLEAFDDMRYVPGKVWNPGECKMAQTGKVITFEFVIGTPR
jgi:TonB family protein